MTLHPRLAFGQKRDLKNWVGHNLQEEGGEDGHSHSIPF